MTSTSDPFSPPSRVGEPPSFSSIRARAERRAAARVADVGAALATLAGVLALLHPLTGATPGGVLALARLGVPAGVLLSLWVGVNAALLLGRSQTGGQWLLGVRVVDRDGIDASLTQLLLREGLFWLALVSGPVGWLALSGEALLAWSVGIGVRDRLTWTCVVHDLE